MAMAAALATAALSLHAGALTSSRQQLHRTHPSLPATASGSARARPAVASVSGAATDALSGARKALAAAGPESLVAVHLEINSWLLAFGGFTILLDPVLEGTLDFGLPPQIYAASKRVLPAAGVIPTLPPIDMLLISQGLDDHAHGRTLAALADAGLRVPIVAPPSAKPALEPLFEGPKIRYLSPGQSTTVTTGAGSVEIRATAGALVGPPWQQRENGFILRSPTSGASVYYEPHCEFGVEELSRLAPVDVVISPITGEGLPGFELVHGPTDALRLVQTLQPRWLLPMRNGEVDATGVAAKLVSKVGSEAVFKSALPSASPRTEMVDVAPGRPVVIEF